MNGENEIAVIKKTDEYIEIKIPRNLTSIVARDKLKKLFSIISSPLFFPDENKTKFNYKNSIKNDKINIAIFCHFLPYYSGGRYYSYILASFLSEFANVTIVSDTSPPYEKDFED